MISFGRQENRKWPVATVKPQTLTRQLPIGKTDLLLRVLDTAQPPSFFFDLARSRFSALIYRGASLLKQILKSTPVVPAELNLRHERFRHIDGNTTPPSRGRTDITFMLVTRQPCRALLPDAATPPQAQRTSTAGQRSATLICSHARDIRDDSESILLHTNM